MFGMKLNTTWDLTNSFSIIYIRWWYAKESINRTSLYYGDVDMPKGFEIDQEKLLTIFYNLHLLINNFHFQELGIC
jgi:hypothetical protein